MSHSPGVSDASHESGDELTNQGKQHAVKDKQYCKTNFTSSSLGRHLDQFITKKRPDGIHNVAEIRKLRAGITRRTARNGKKGDSAGAHDGRDDNTSNEEHTPGERSAQPSVSFIDAIQKAPPGANDVRLNRMNWQATGVITDSAAAGASQGATVSPHATSASTPSGAPAHAGQKRSYSTFATDMQPSALADTARALELSLREVLDTVRAATKRSNPVPAPFAFDFAAQTFPSLCLALLPVPATIFKVAPFATPSTIPLAPPGPDQLYALQQEIPAILDRWKWAALSHAQRNPIPGGNSVGEEAEQLSRIAQNHVSESLAHVDSAFQYYMSRSPDEREALWNIELLRALKTEQDKVANLTNKVERMAQESSQLQQQIDYISRCQWPREMALWPPDRLTFDTSMQNELRGSSLALVFPEGSMASPRTAHLHGPPSEVSDTIIRGSDRWDFDKLVNKWKRHVREDRARKAGQPGPSTLFPSDHSATNTATANTPSAINHRKNTMGPETGFSSGSHLVPSGISSARNSPPNGHRSSEIYDPARNDSSNGAGAQGARQPQPGTSIPPPPTVSVPPVPNSGNVQIISDVHDHMARYIPWFRQERERELEEKRRAAEEDED